MFPSCSSVTTTHGKTYFAFAVDFCSVFSILRYWVIVSVHSYYADHLMSCLGIVPTVQSQLRSRSATQRSKSRSSLESCQVFLGDQSVGHVGKLRVPKVKQ